MDAREFSSLVGAVYDTVLRPEHWQDVLARICRAIDAKAASVHVINPLQGHASLYVEHGTEPEWTALLLTQYAMMTPIGAAILVADVDQPVGAFDFIDEEEYVESRFYKEWCAPQGYYDMMGALITKSANKVGSLGTTRLKEKGLFGNGEREFIGLMAPHVRRAVTLSGLLQQQANERKAIAAVIDKLSCAVAVINQKGEIANSNGAADAILADGKVVTRRDKSVSFPDAATHGLFLAALASDTMEPHFIAVRGKDGEAYLAVAMLLDVQERTFALFVNKPEPDMPAIARPLTALYGFTPREVAVLMPLLEGKTIESVADLLGISQATARTHLNRLFHKTGTNRQIDLVQKVINQLPPLKL